MIKEAILLAGGMGTRLQAAVPNLAKCIAPVNGIPFIAYVINVLQQQGITRFIFSLGYKSDSIIDFTEEQYQSLDRVYIIENEPLGTGGAIKEACKAAQEENVLVVNGDTLFSIDVQQLADIHSKQQAHCTLALKPMNNFSRYGAVEINSNGQVTAFREKQFYRHGLINGGVYALQVKHFLQQQHPPVFSFEKDYLEKNIHRHHICGMAFDDYFIDIGVPEDYERAQKELPVNHSEKQVLK